MDNVIAAIALRRIACTYVPVDDVENLKMGVSSANKKDAIWKVSKVLFRIF